MTRKIIMDSDEIKRALNRMTFEMIEQNKGGADIVIVGIRTGGAPLSQRIKDRIKVIEGVDVPIGVLDINLYRDDWSKLSSNPIVKKTSVPQPINDKTLILVDDVIYTGRTTRAALEAIMDMGRPRKIQLAALVDRGRRELPIQPDFTGVCFATSSDERVNVFLEEIDGKDEVVLEKNS